MAGTVRSRRITARITVGFITCRWSFLLGRLFEDSLSNLGISETMNAALNDLGLDSTELAEAEYDAGLGNGGLGRLAACLLDSMATF